MKSILVGLLLLCLISCANHKVMPVNILNMNKGNILTPSEVDSISWKDVRDGFVYEIAQSLAGSSKPHTILTYKLTKIDGKRFYFDTYQDNELVGEESVMYKNGKLFNSYNGKKFKQFLPFKGCELKLGKCDFTGFRNKKVTMTTSFKDGVWINKYSNPGYTNRSITIKSVYDKLGLLLYKRTIAVSSTLPNDSVTTRLR